MKKPKLKNFKRFEKISDYPQGTYFESGHLVDKNSGWRTLKPKVIIDKCKNCNICYLYCPDGTILRGEKFVSVDFDFCKGCGICEKVCPFGAIEMEVER